MFESDEIASTSAEMDHSRADEPGCSGASGGRTVYLDHVPEPEGTNMEEEKQMFQVDKSLIPTASLEEVASSELQELGLDVFNQEDFEQGVIAQVDHAMAKEEEERKKKIFEKETKSIDDDVSMVKKELEDVEKVIATLAGATLKSDQKRLDSAKRHKMNKLKQLKTLEVRKNVLKLKIQGAMEMRQEELAGPISPDISNYSKVLAIGNGRSKETEIQQRIRKGEMTPFGTVIEHKTGLTTAKKEMPTEFGKFLLKKDKKKQRTHSSQMVTVPTKIKKVARFDDSQELSTSLKSKSKEDNFFNKRDKRHYRSDVEGSYCPKQWKTKYPKLQHEFVGDPELSDSGEREADDEVLSSDPEYQPSRDEDLSEDINAIPQKKAVRRKKSAASTDTSSGADDDYPYASTKHKITRGDAALKTTDDGEEYSYLMRIEDFEREERERMRKKERDGEPESEDEEFDGGLIVPSRIWKRLYKYQRTCVRWLWELDLQQAGGIVGDEMGLGKTIQIIAYLAALRQSKLPNKLFSFSGIGPTLIVCPTTVMHQWVKEFHTWWPPFRVAILHSSGSYTGSERELVYSILKCHGVLITSYSSLVLQQDHILPHRWHYVVLDEGHKIRNPDAQATLAVKQIKTPHRLILSGSPIQNNLKELWSLFDFVFPGKLGTLPDFLQNFAVPIVQGGYSNASQVQVTTAYKCASVLRDTISPYLLRRMKADVKINLPDKNEQVLFCRLTKEQEDVYKEYLESRECQAILAGRFQIFAGLITLRKICNHPDISTGGPRLYIGESTKDNEELEYGYHQRSGKMIVVKSLLKLWKKQEHRCLLFSQSRVMLDIFEAFVKKEGYNYMRMDGGTAIGSRQSMVNKFNQEKNIFVFLLTTRVGGLGINLIGASRIIIFDPDWNPSTDTQARERAWRIGQKKQVTIYRLVTTGTIEEKIYHRQIFKQFLTNKVLKDPMQRRFFKSNDLYELFTLGSNEKRGETETSAIFAGTGSEVRVKKPKINRFDKMKEEEKSDDIDEKTLESSFNDDEIRRMRKLAHALSKKIKESNESEIPQEKHHKKKKKKKKHKDASFEGERIPHLDKQKEYKQTSDADEKKRGTSMDDYVLHKLFKKSGGIHSAVQHDAIMDAGSPDYILVENEANRVASQAVQALKKSRSQCQGALSGVPNWTGQHGGVDRPRFGRKKNNILSKETDQKKSNSPTHASTETAPRFGNKKPKKLFDGAAAGTTSDMTEAGTSSPAELMTSDMLIGRMLHRNVNSSNQEFSQLLTGIDPANYQLITDLRNFMLFEGSNIAQATTQEILDFFRPKLPPSDSAKFKAMLDSICTFQKMGEIGFWRLKQEFR